MKRMAVTMDADLMSQTPITPFTNLVDDKGELAYPTAAWPDFQKEMDKVHSLNASQARMINHQAKGIFTSSLESLLVAKGERVLLMEVCCSPESILSAEVERAQHRAVRITAADINMALPDKGPELICRLRQDLPRYMWISIPCDPTSLLTKLRAAHRTPTQE